MRSLQKKYLAIPALALLALIYSHNSHVKLTTYYYAAQSTITDKAQVFYSDTPPTPPSSDTSKYLKGPPTTHFRENLKDDVRYITTFTDGGWTNCAMIIMNMIWLGVLTDRVPILPPFAPFHIEQWDTAPAVDFGDVFDLPRFREAARISVIQWSDVKVGKEVDQVGCWSVWAPVSPDDSPKHTILKHHLSLDASHSRAPKSAYVHEGTPFTTFSHLSKLSFPEGRAKALEGQVPIESHREHHTRLPDEQLLCFDFLYWVVEVDDFDWEKDYSVMWRKVGRHLHFTNRIMDIATEYLRDILKVEPGDEIPHFIGLHIRRGDQGRPCPEPRSSERCYTSLEDYDEEIKRIKARLRKSGQIIPHHVVVTTDERDPGWLKQTAQRGWKVVNHGDRKTTLTYGPHMPVYIDAALLSMAAGLVGSSGSTFSLLAIRRVEDWNGGVGSMI